MHEIYIYIIQMGNLNGKAALEQNTSLALISWKDLETLTSILSQQQQRFWEKIEAVLRRDFWDMTPQEMENSVRSKRIPIIVSDDTINSLLYTYATNIFHIIALECSEIPKQVGFPYIVLHTALNEILVEELDCIKLLKNGSYMVEVYTWNGKKKVRDKKTFSPKKYWGKQAAILMALDYRKRCKTSKAEGDRNNWKLDPLEKQVEASLLKTGLLVRENWIVKVKGIRIIPGNSSRAEMLGIDITLNNKRLNTELSLDYRYRESEAKAFRAAWRKVFAGDERSFEETFYLAIEKICDFLWFPNSALPEMKFVLEIYGKKHLYTSRKTNGITHSATLETETPHQEVEKLTDTPIMDHADLQHISAAK